MNICLTYWSGKGLESASYRISSTYTLNINISMMFHGQFLEAMWIATGWVDVKRFLKKKFILLFTCCSSILTNSNIIKANEWREEWKDEERMTKITVKVHSVIQYLFKKRQDKLREKEEAKSFEIGNTSSVWRFFT